VLDHTGESYRRKISRNSISRFEVVRKGVTWSGRASLGQERVVGAPVGTHFRRVSLGPSASAAEACHSLRQRRTWPVNCCCVRSARALARVAMPLDPQLQASLSTLRKQNRGSSLRGALVMWVSREFYWVPTCLAGCACKGYPMRFDGKRTSNNIPQASPDCKLGTTT
jgi:hypothetical protein